MKRRPLPQCLDDLRGLRAARWIRESSAKQGDRYGPGAQRQMQDEAIDRHGLVDTGLSWMVLKSGWTGKDGMEDPPATKTPDFQAMLRAAANHEFEVLLVGYSSRFLRSVRVSLQYLHYFHLNGAVVVICDDLILSSDPKHFERLIDRVKADEVYSQTLGRNISTGLAEKRRAMGDPGGQPPLGFRRQDSLLVVDPTTMASVTRAFDLSAAGQPDHEVADALGLTVHTVRHVLTNPVYLGQLTDGSPLRLGPTVEVSTWNLVQARREDRRTRVPGTTPRRCYALKLVCLDCGAPLHGHGGRYRHAGSACAGFTASRPDMAPAQGRHASTAGTSYPREWYESVVEHLLGRLAVTDERAIRRVVTELAADKTSPIDQFALARIARARNEALRRLEQSRDVASWQATVARLDAEEAAVRTEVRGPSVIPEAAIRSYLANLGEVWATADDSSRQAIALALFERLAVSGFRILEYTWSATARSYGMDRLVPEELVIDLSALGLRAGPLGTLVVRSEARTQGADLAVSA